MTGSASPDPVHTPAPGTRHSATVVIVTWNAAHLLRPCLEAMRAQDLPATRYGVLVIDNGSTDATSEVLRDFPDVDVMALRRNLGFAGGVAAALAVIDTEYVVLLNNDARPEPQWLRHLLEPLETDPSIVATTSKILLDRDYYIVELPRSPIISVRLGEICVSDLCLVRAPHDLLVPALTREGLLRIDVADPHAAVQVDVRSLQPECVINSVGLELTPELRAADRGYLESDHGQYAQAVDVFGFCGGAAAMRREALMAVGGFDSYLFLYAEDLDASWRLQRAGGRIRYAPDAVVRHRHGESSRIGSDLFYYYNLRNRILVLIANAGLSELTRALRASVVSLVQRAVPAPPVTARPGFAGRTARPSARVLVRALGGVVRGLPHAIARRRRRRPSAARA